MGILDQRWETLNLKPISDVIFATKTIFLENEDIEKIQVGTDSQNYGRRLDFETAIVLYRQGKGARGFATRTRIKKSGPIGLWDKLYKEISFSIEVARALENAGIPPEYIEIHIDANTDPKWKSSNYARSLAGIVMGHGFSAKLKPEAWAASYVSEHRVKNRHITSRDRKRFKRNLRTRARHRKGS